MNSGVTYSRLVDQQEAVRLPGYRQQTREVVVEAELTALGGAGLRVDVERRCALQNRVAPTDDDALLVAAGDDDRVVAVGRDGCEVHARRCLLSGGRCRCRGGCLVSTAGGEGRARTDGQHCDAAGLQHRPSGHRLDDVAEVFVGAGVGDGFGARVTALVAAGDVLAFGLAVVRDEQVQRNEGHGGRIYESSVSSR